MRLKKLAEIQFIRFLLVGALNTAFGYLCFAFFVYLGFGAVSAPLFATVLAVLFNFKTIGLFVFKNNDNRLLFRFFIVYGIVYISNVAGLKILGYWGLKNLYLAGLALVLPLAFFAYCLNKKFVFERIKK